MKYVNDPDFPVGSTFIWDGPDYEPIQMKVIRVTKHTVKFDCLSRNYTVTFHEKERVRNSKHIRMVVNESLQIRTH